MLKKLAAFLDYLNYARGLSPLTLTAYRTDLETCIAFLEQHHITALSAVTSDDLIRYLTHLRAKGYADRSLLRHAASLKSFFAWLLDERYITQNPTDLFPTGKRAQPLPRTIDETPLCKILEELTGETPIDLRDRAILELLYGCGLRCAELCALTLHDVDFNQQHLRIFGKGRRERIVPFGEPAKKALKQYLQWRHTFAEKLMRKQKGVQLNQPTAPLFLSPRGKKLLRSHLSEIVRRRIRPYLPDTATHITPHVLRHAFATHLLDHGAPLLDIRDLLGHASVSTTQIYTHVSNKGLQKTFRDCFPRA